jgi:hypothetical protein
MIVHSTWEEGSEVMLQFPGLVEKFSTNCCMKTPEVLVVPKFYHDEEPLVFQPHERLVDDQLWLCIPGVQGLVPTLLSS